MKDKNITGIVFTEEQIKKRVSELASELNVDYADKRPILISVLKGALYFTADLTRQMTIPLNIELLEIDPLSSEDEANSGQTGGVVKINKELERSITGRHVIIVEDIIDTGLTLAYLLKTLSPCQPKSISVCVLLDCPSQRLVDLPIKYKGFEVPDGNLVGYGLDYKEDYRHLPYIARHL